CIKPIHLILRRLKCLPLPKLTALRLIPRAPENNSWNNLSAIRLTERMFHAEPLPVFFAASPRPCSPATPLLRPTEALRTMPSALNRNAAFDQLAPPLFASLYNHAHWLPRNPSEPAD